MASEIVWRFESVHDFGFDGNLYQKMHFAGSNPATEPKGNEIVRCTMKSGKLGRNLRRAASDEIKSAFISCLKADFIAKRFHPPKVDFFRHRRI